MTEIVLVLPVMFMMLTVVIDLGFYLYKFASIQQAMREGMRIGLAGGRFTDTQIRNHIVDTSGLAMLRSQDITVSSASSVRYGMTTYKKLTIIVNHTHNFFVPPLFTPYESVSIRSTCESIVVTGLKNPG